MKITDQQIRKLLLTGVFSVNKVKHWTSVEVLEELKRVLIEGLHPHQRPKLLKVGHGGTLDQTATGVLVVGVCLGCKVLPTFLHGEKKYIVEARLGIATDTYNDTGIITKEASYDHISKDSLENILRVNFVGKLLQTPPKYSALKRNGVRLADMVRHGVDVTVAPRHVECYSASCMQFSPPLFKLLVHCGGGCYVRSIVHDLGEKLGSCAHVTQLHRIQHGAFTEAEMLSREEWSVSRILGAIQAGRARHPALAALLPPPAATPHARWLGR